MLISVFDIVKYSRCWLIKWIKCSLDTKLRVWSWEKENVEEDIKDKTQKNSNHKSFTNTLTFYWGTKTPNYINFKFNSLLDQWFISHWLYWCMTISFQSDKSIGRKNIFIYLSRYVQNQVRKKEQVTKSLWTTKKKIIKVW